MLNQWSDRRREASRDRDDLITRLEWTIDVRTHERGECDEIRVEPELTAKA